MFKCIWSTLGGKWCNVWHFFKYSRKILCVCVHVRTLAHARVRDCVLWEGAEADIAKWNKIYDMLIIVGADQWVNGNSSNRSPYPRVHVWKISYWKKFNPKKWCLRGHQKVEKWKRLITSHVLFQWTSLSCCKDIIWRRKESPGSAGLAAVTLWKEVKETICLFQTADARMLVTKGSKTGFEEEERSSSWPFLPGIQSSKLIAFRG